MASFGTWVALSLFASAAIGCSNIVGIDDLPPATDNGSTSCGTCPAGQTCSSAGVCTCGAVTGTTACDQCVADQCCVEAAGTEADTNAEGAFGCIRDGASETVSQICACLSPYGGPNSYLESPLVLCEYEKCGAICGALGVGVACTATTSSACAFGPCVADNTGATACRQFCCGSQDCASGHACVSVTSVSGGTTFVCN